MLEPLTLRAGSFPPNVRAEIEHHRRLILPEPPKRFRLAAERARARWHQWLMGRSSMRECNGC